MSLPTRVSFLFLAILSGLLLAWGLVAAAPGNQASSDTATAQALPTPMPLPNQPDQPVRPGVRLAPDISFIDSPSAACELPKAHTGVCYMTWSYLYAYADPNYMITMTVNIDGKNRARFNGFFQTYIYVPSEMLVFRVPCGTAGSGGDPSFGMSHSYTIRGRDSAGLGAANYGSVTCPADEPYHVFLSVVRK